MVSNRNTILAGALLVLGVAVPVVLAVEATHQSACDRGCLIEFTSSYLDAMLAHNPAALKTAPDVKVTENGRPITLGEGFWKTAKAIPARQAFADPTTGEAGFFGTVRDTSGQSVELGLRLKIDHQRIEQIDTVVSPE